MAEWKLGPEHYPEPEVSVWDENWETIQIFIRLSTQWRAGMGGPTSLDYMVVFKEFERIGLSGDEFEESLSKLHVIEREALNQIHGD